MCKYKAIKFDNFIIYVPGVSDIELNNFLNSNETKLETSSGKFIKYDNNKYYLKEWDEYYVVGNKENKLQAYDFDSIGKLYNNNFGLIKIKNFIGEIIFKGQLFLVESYKITTDEFNKLLNQIDDEIKDLISIEFNYEGTTSSSFSSKNSNQFNYFQYIKIYNLMEKNMLMPHFKYIRNNAVTSFDKEKEKVHISLVSNISVDSLIDIFSGNTKLSKVNKKNILSKKFKGYVPEYINEYNYYLHVDTPENQFIKYFLKNLIQQTSSFIDEIEIKHSSEYSTGSEILLSKLSQHRKKLITEYNEQFYKDISNLKGFDLSNTVLTQKYGYKNLFKEYLNIKNQPKAIFNTESLIDLFQNKSVDKLYEYISLFSILKILRSIYSCNTDFNEDYIVSSKNKVMTLIVSEDDKVSFEFGSRLDLPKVTLYFQKSFTMKNEGSWSVNFTPDCTLKVCFKENKFKYFHFDSKFKINPKDGEKTEDIQKMHSYRDGIYNTYGAYVLYPGENVAQYSNFEKSLMKIGALPLKFNENKELKKFINDLIKLEC